MPYATVIQGKARRGGRIIKAGPKAVVVQLDKPQRLVSKGDRRQRYTFKRDAKGEKITFKRLKNGKLVSPKADAVIIGARSEYKPAQHG